MESEIDKLKREYVELEVKYYQAMGALGYPTPDRIPHNENVRCGMCDAKEKDYQRQRIECQTVWNAFKVLAESTR